MTKKLKEETFVERTMKRRREKTEEVVPELLATMLKEDIFYRDFHYVVARAREIIEEAVKKVNFRSEEIRLARKKMLASVLKDVNNAIVKKNVEIKNDTDERDMRCEDSAHYLAKLVLSNRVMLSDDEYFSDAIEDDDKMLLNVAARGYIDSIYDLLMVSLSESERRAMNKLWGTDMEKVTLSKLNDVLKEK